MPPLTEALAESLSPTVGLTPFELATGYTGGPADDVPAELPTVPDDLSSLDALEQAILPALERGPCFVSFSGGRDSSAVLAVATRAARRMGLPDPVPITYRFPEAPLAAEAQWQERVLDHLGLSDWRLIDVRDELDYVGPVAGPLLRRHGVLYPFTAHCHLPLAKEAGSGTVLTGGGGDALFAAWRWEQEMQIITGGVRPRPRQLPRLGYFLSPLPLRRVVAGWIRLPRRPWLTPRGQTALRRAIARDANEPRSFRGRLAWLARRRNIALAKRSAGVIAAETGVRIEDPLFDRSFMAALARESGATGPGDRSAAMRRLFGDLLPDEVLGRETKALFAEVYFGPHSREFLRSWDGASPFPDMVDSEGLRHAFDKGDFDTPRLLLQTVWLAAQA